MAAKPTYDDLEQRIAMLEDESVRRNRFEAINSALFKISNAVNTTSDLDELFSAIHLTLSSIIDTTNFYIALYDEANDSLMFPYFVDSADDNKPPVVEISKTESITAEIIRTGRPVMVTKAERLAQRAKTSLAIPPYTPSEIWLGVPLKIRNQIVGVMTVQSYHDPKCYDQTDMDVMVSVADQVATAIERKKAEELLRDSEERLRIFFNGINEAIFVHEGSKNGIPGRFIEVNDSACRRLGYSRGELLTMCPTDIDAPETIPNVPLMMETLYAMGSAVWEGVHVCKDGKRIAVEIANQLVLFGGRHIIISTARDITERKRAEEALLDSEHLYRATVENISDTVLITDDQGNFTYVCPNTNLIFGIGKNDITALGNVSFLFGTSIFDPDELNKKNEICNIESKIIDGHGQEHFLLVNIKKVSIQKGTILYVCRDITDRRRAEEYLKIYQNIVSSTTDGIAFIDNKYRYIIVNNAYESYSGIKQEKFIGLAVAEYLGEDVFKQFIQPSFDRCLQGEIINYQEWFDYSILGRKFIDVTYSPYRDNTDRIVGVIANTRDITERKLREDERFLAARLIGQIGTPGDFHEHIEKLIESLQDLSGCEAIGIRLREGDDYPYYETRGLPHEFVESEKHLCAYGPDGNILRDGTGNPVLECMCGNILCGRFDPAKPFFSAHGSFWTNSTTALLASTTEADRKARTRNRCNGMGYESVALIPLHTGNEVFGLLQFNDHRPDRFNPDLIAHFERIADSLAMALSQRQAVEALRVSEERLRAVASSIPGALYQFIRRKDGAFEIPFVSEGAVSLLGRPLAELKDASLLFDNVHPDDVDGMWSSIAESTSSLTQWEHEFRIVGKKGTIKWLRGVSSPSALPDRSICWNGVLLDITNIKTAEETLKHSQAMLARTESVAHVGSWEWDMASDTVTWSDELFRIFQRNPADGAPSFAEHPKLYDPEDLQRLRKAVEDAVSTGKPYEIELRAIRKDGVTRICRARGHAEMGPGGKATRLFGSLQDITDLKRAEQDYKMLFLEMLDGFALHEIICDEAGNPVNYRFLAINPAFERMTGLKADEITGKTVLDILPGIERHWIETYGNVALSGKPTFFENYSVELKKYFQVTTFKPAPKQFACIFIDITERKQAEAALRKSEEKYRMVADFNYDWEYWMSPDRRFLYCSPSCARITGYRADEFEKDSGLLRRIIHPDDHYQFDCHLTGDDGSDHTSHKQEFRIFSRSGEMRWIAHICISVHGRDGAYLGRRASNRDITERVRINEEKAKLESRLQQAQKMESIGSLAGGIAHDLNNILFPISGLSEMLLDELPAGNPEYESIEQIHKSAQRGSDLVKQILAFSRQSNPQKLPIRIQPILKEVLKLSRATIPMNIEITSHIKADCGMVSADPTQIHQIAMNLVTNAYHAVEQTGGTINLELKEIVFEKDDSLKSGNYACISISDTGIGIDKTLIDKIFDPYFTTKEQGKGTGLGLSVVQGIVKEHGGDIRVYSEVGKGTVFHVYLPLLEDNGDIKTAAVIKQYPTGHERVLLVDDEEPILRMEQMMLERLGYRVTARTSSPDALAALKANPDNFDLVISDKGMPNMTGEQLAGELIAIRPGIPIILCTGFSNENDVKRAKAMGVKEFLIKPVAIGDLAEMVRKVLDDGANKMLVNASGQTDTTTPAERQFKDQGNG